MEDAVKLVFSWHSFLITLKIGSSQETVYNFLSEIKDNI